ncbi:MAG: tRNA (adenine57-N1/adenine58-N1)-methyltransferase catalytic subunit [Thermoplasmata archaeon]|jgi:tRNA (adenine57-N1/adenine58-N1)-methyltransferase|nr:tRNA (adenine57-N1/adenine58-N1)-methyltransferase catalytic subunit [Thermoplasmata archaeon]
MTAVQAGDRVALLEPDTGHVHLVQLDGQGARKQKGLGVFDPARIEGLPYGARATVGAKAVVVLRPDLVDLAATLQRKAQIITPKDASRIVWELGVGVGSRVLESGIGSGAVTLPLLWAVGPAGEVVAQELRDEFADWARDNARRAGLDARLRLAIGDLTQGLAPGVAGPFQACLLDQPEPWLALPHVVPVLAPGARVACYTPQVSQMEATVRALGQLGFAQVRALELIERGWEVKERGSRPSFEGLGHTGFLVFARWLGHAPPN